MRVDDYVRAIATTPDGAATIALARDDGPDVSYAGLAQLTDGAATAFAQCGVGRGERVVLVGENTVDMVIALLGVMRAGGWAVPLNARMAPGEVDAILEHCAPRVAYFSPASPEALAHAQRHGAREGPEALAGSRIVRRDNGDAAAEPGLEDVALMIYTSGTTGRPKGVMLTHANMEFVTGASLAQRVLVPGDRIFHALPVSHSFGLISALLCALRAGATVQLCTRFSAERLARAILEDGITVFQGVPAMYARLVDWSVQAGRALTPNRLRLAYIGGSQIDPTRKQQAQTLLGVQLHHGYGLTESAPAATRTIGHPPPSTITAGWPIPGVEVVVRDETGRPADAGSPGEVCIRGPNVMKGYFRDAEQTRAVIDSEGWLHTGDIGEFGPAGDLRIVGRIKEMIIRGGFNVYPAEVEAAIGAFAGIAQCAVVGCAIPGDEEIVAFIEPQPGATIDTRALERFLRERIAPYKMPSRWITMDALPAGGTGKLLKAQMKRMAQAQEAP